LDYPFTTYVQEPTGSSLNRFICLNAQTREKQLGKARIKNGPSPRFINYNYANTRNTHTYTGNSINAKTVLLDEGSLYTNHLPLHELRSCPLSDTLPQPAPPPMQHAAWVINKRKSETAIHKRAGL